MSQLSFFSAESVPPAVADLTGVLAAAGQVVMVGGGARLSVVVEESWRARALADMMTEAGLDAEIARTEENTPLVRTAVDVRLVGIATDWTRGAVKTVAATSLRSAATVRQRSPAEQLFLVAHRQSSRFASRRSSLQSAADPVASVWRGENFL